MEKYRLKVLIIVGLLAVQSYSPMVSLKEKIPFKLDNSFFLPMHHQGILNAKAIKECSGITCSQVNTGKYLWVHNDGGDQARLFLIDDKAKLKCTYYMKGLTQNDWEEISGFFDSTQYTLWIGDLGTNTKKRSWVSLVELNEPLYKYQRNDTVYNYKVHYIQYPDRMRNTEAFVIDQQSKELYFFTKESDSSVVYSISMQELKSNDSSILHKLYKLPIPYVTGGSLSADGLALLLKNYSDVYYFRLGEFKLKNIMDAQICRVDYTREPQGESITWSWGNQGFYTLSEQSSNFMMPMLCFYKKKNTIQSEN